MDIAILIGEPDSLGQGVGSCALTVLLGRLRGEGAPSAEMATSIGTHRDFRVVKKAGFVFFRNFQDPDEPYRYMVACLREDTEPSAARDGAARIISRPAG